MVDASDRERQLAAASYIGRMAAELRGLATAAELHFMAYLAAMLEEDALATASRLRISDDIDEDRNRMTAASGAETSRRYRR